MKQIVMAMCVLLTMCIFGENVFNAETIKAAEQGNAEAQYNLGMCYANGDGVAKDMKEAVKLKTNLQR